MFARALVALAEKNVAAGAYNIGSGTLTRVMDIVDMVCTSFAMPLPRMQKRSYTRNQRVFYADISKLKKATGWKPLINIKGGVSTLLQNSKT